VKEDERELEDEEKENEAEKERSIYKGIYLGWLEDQRNKTSREIREKELKEICNNMHELLSIEEEMEDAGKHVWYEVVVYITSGGIKYQIVGHKG